MMLVLWLVFCASAVAMDVPINHAGIIRSRLCDLSALGVVLTDITRSCETGVKTRVVLEVLNDIPEFPAFQLLLNYLHFHQFSDEEWTEFPAPLFIQQIVMRGLDLHFARLCEHDQIFSRWILPDVTGQRMILDGPGLLFLTNSPEIVRIIGECGGSLDRRDASGNSALMFNLMGSDVTRASLTKKSVALILYGASFQDALSYLTEHQPDGLANDLREISNFKEGLDAALVIFEEVQQSPEANYLNIMPSEIQALIYEELVDVISRDKADLIEGFPF